MSHAVWCLCVKHDLSAEHLPTSGPLKGEEDEEAACFATAPSKHIKAVAVAGRLFHSDSL